ncbi:hypothetical protein CHCC15337_2192 [Bacillus paralicheniformis]|nr:hypothetical protein CHCC19468_3043 [Bacillus paralicheniformis]TWL10777.1 hypothetical protein CHCC19467_3607 [Bacillus paralicheniformis]TWL38159.1 hypothetical protein CHCC15337_2192 [Bacillus paralicheniformis]TWL47354.1 hypothetical protein CHCC15332_3373 [Bacillus paralicheniformis]
MNEIPNHIQTKATTVKLKDGMYNQRAYVADWFKPARTVSTIGWITPKSIPNH